MKGKNYDLDILTASGLFDLTVVSRFFYNTQEYFDALTDFERNYRRDLANHTPAVVAYSSESREDFIKECFDVRSVFVRLGMPELLRNLDNLENAAITKHEKGFSDGQIKMRATIEIYKETIKKAETRWKMTRY